jgi:hypothetical protein
VPTSVTRPSRRILPYLVVAGLALAGCDHPPTANGASSPSVSTPAAPTSAGSTEEAERAAVEAAYTKFWSVSWGLDRRPPGQWGATLATVATNPVLSRLYEGTRLQRAQGTRLYGQVVPHPTLRALTGGTARVIDCQDASHAGQADARTGTPKTVGVARSPVTATLTRGPDGVWRVADVDYPGGTC